MAENRVAAMNGLVIQGALGPKTYGLVVTDRRSIFVLQSASKGALGAALGGAVGAVLAQAATKDRTIDVGGSDPDALARDGANLVIPHASIQNLRVKKSWGTYRLEIEYVREDGKRKKVSAEAMPTLQGAKSLGITLKEFTERQGKQLQDTYRAALPPTVLPRAEFRV